MIILTDEQLKARKDHAQIKEIRQNMKSNCAKKRDDITIMVQQVVSV